jgi:hypothetical protein
MLLLKYLWLVRLLMAAGAALAVFSVVVVIRLLREERAAARMPREPRYVREPGRLADVVARRLVEAHAVSAPADEVAREVEEALRPELRVTFAPPGAAA